MASTSTDKTIWTLGLVGVFIFLAYKLWPSLKKLLGGAGSGSGSSGGGAGNTNYYGPQYPGQQSGQGQGSGVGASVGLGGGGGGSGAGSLSSFLAPINAYGANAANQLAIQTGTQEDQLSEGIDTSNPIQYSPDTSGLAPGSFTTAFNGLLNLILPSQPINSDGIGSTASDNSQLEQIETVDVNNDGLTIGDAGSGDVSDYDGSDDYSDDDYIDSDPDDNGGDDYANADNDPDGDYES